VAPIQSEISRRVALEFVPIDYPARLTNRPLFDPCAVIATLGFHAESVGSVPHRILQGVFNIIDGSDPATRWLQKLYRYFNSIRVRSFVLNVAPFTRGFLNHWRS
jgi:hypothetical protein